MTMTRIEASVEINAPVKDVFEFVSDWRHWRDCWESVSGLRPTTTITRGNGSRFAYKTWIAGLSFHLETEVHDFEENVGWKGVATSGFPHGTQWVFEPLDGRTRITYVLEYNPAVLLLGSLADRFLLRPMWRRRVKKSLENIKLSFKGRQGS